mgnify:CR=1 FL=1
MPGAKITVDVRNATTDAPIDAYSHVDASQSVTFMLTTTQAPQSFFDAGVELYHRNTLVESRVLSGGAFASQSAAGNVTYDDATERFSMDVSDWTDASPPTAGDVFSVVESGSIVQTLSFTSSSGSVYLFEAVGSPTAGAAAAAAAAAATIANATVHAAGHLAYAVELSSLLAANDTRHMTVQFKVGAGAFTSVQTGMPNEAFTFTFSSGSTFPETPRIEITDALVTSASTNIDFRLKNVPNRFETLYMGLSSALRIELSLLAEAEQLVVLDESQSVADFIIAHPQFTGLEIELANAITNFGPANHGKVVFTFDVDASETAMQDLATGEHTLSLARVLSGTVGASFGLYMAGSDTSTAVDVDTASTVLPHPVPEAGKLIITSDGAVRILDETVVVSAT